MSLTLLLSVLLIPGNVEAATPASPEEELRALGLPTDPPSLLDFIRLRTRLEVDVAALTKLAEDLAGNDPRVNGRAAAGLIAHGTAALPILRRLVNDLGDPARTARARKCIQTIEGQGSDSLPVCVVRLLAQRRPAGATEALLAYLPAAENERILDETGKALAVLAYAEGKPQAALLAALQDTLPLRRAVACAALAQADHPEQYDVLRPLLRDARAAVRLRAALALLTAGDAESVPVLIELLNDLPAPDWQQAEEALKGLAGPWAPAVELKGEDDIARRIRRDVWAVWWKHTEGPALLAEFRQRTLTPADQTRAAALIEKLNHDDFDTRHRAAGDLISMGTRVVPLLREAMRGKDLERARRASECVDRITVEARPLPPSAIRLLCLRKPEGALQALLDFLPYTEELTLLEEVHTGLPRLAGKRGVADPLLVMALADRSPVRRMAAAEALLTIAGERQLHAIRKLLTDADATVRIRTALLLARARDRSAIPVLIDSLAEEPSEYQTQAQEILERLAGEKAPETPAAEDAAARKKIRDAWAAWWKASADTVNLEVPPQQLGYTLLVESPQKGNGGRVRELGPDGKQRWVIEGLDQPFDAQIVGGNRVIIAEYGGNIVSERDFKGTVIWKIEVNSPLNCQRLANGNTFVATTSQFLEIDRTGKVTWQMAHKDVDAGIKGPDGVITCLTRDNRVVRLLPNGQEVKAFPCKRKDDVGGGIDLLPNGRILVAQPSDNTVAEMDLQGNVITTYPAQNVTSASPLLGGNILVAHQEQNRVTEVDRSGRVVNTIKSDWGIWRARRR